MKVAVIGDALIDEMRDESGSIDAPGGSALNVAVGLAILGVDATLIAMIGDDDDGAVLKNYAQRFGVTVLAAPSQLGTGRAVSDRTDGEPRYSFSDAARARSIQFTAEMDVAIATATLVAVSGFPFDNAAEVAALRAALSHSERVLVDANPRAGFLRDAPAFVSALESLAATAELVKIGDEDAHLLYGLPLDEVIPRLRSRVVLATKGAAGATAHIGEIEVHRDITRDDRPIVDTMGAGDATFASVIAQLASGGAVESADDWGTMLDSAMAVAAETVRHAGGTLQQR